MKKFNSLKWEASGRGDNLKRKKENQTGACVCSPQPVSGKQKRQQQLGLDGTEDPMLPWEEFKIDPHEKDKDSYIFTNMGILKP